MRHRALVLANIAVLGCAKAPAPETGSGPALDLKPGGARVTVAQRSDGDVPGSDGRLRVHIGDITGGQVALTLKAEDGDVLVGTTSVRVGETVPFSYGGRRYRLAVEKLQNRIVGTDEAVLSVREAARATERELIEGLIRAVAESDATFLRNGEEHDAKEAAEHLRNKWERAGDRVKTAEQFTEHLASRSSMTGRPYRIREAGTTVPAGDWLRARLEKLRAE